MGEETREKGVYGTCQGDMTTPCTLSRSELETRGRVKKKRGKFALLRRIKLRRQPLKVKEG